MSVAGFVLAAITAYVLLAAVVLALLRAVGSPYPPEASEVPSGIEEEAVAPDVAFERARPLTEAGPLVVAGSDLDWSDRKPMALVNLTLRLMVDADPELAALRTKPAELAELYVAPEVDR